jgi:simple sugar transport system permease protein
MNGLLELVLSTTFLAGAVRMAVPLMVAGVGEVVSERAGILNIGLEGMMLAGAFGGVVGASFTGSAWLGLLWGVAAAIIVVLPHGLVSIRFGGDQVVSGVALNIAVLGITSFLARILFGVGRDVQVPRLGIVPLGSLAEVPFVGPVLLAQVPVLYLGLVVAGTAWFLLNRTIWGLRWRAAGDEPRALEAVGVPVARVRWTALVFCAACAGLAGTAIALGQVGTFVEGMTAGRGFIVLALVIASRWHPFGVLLMAVFFGAADAFALRVQTSGSESIPYQIALMLPYVLTLLIYAFVARNDTTPRALGTSHIE